MAGPPPTRVARVARPPLQWRLRCRAGPQALAAVRRGRCVVLLPDSARVVAQWSGSWETCHGLDHVASSRTGFGAQGSRVVESPCCSRAASPCLTIRPGMCRRSSRLESRPWPCVLLAAVGPWDVERTVACVAVVGPCLRDGGSKRCSARAAVHIRMRSRRVLIWSQSLLWSETFGPGCGTRGSVFHVQNPAMRRNVPLLLPEAVRVESRSLTGACKDLQRNPSTDDLQR
jgi:hypothetical protein